MRNFYTETVSTCHRCGRDIPGKYWFAPEGVYLETACPDHGTASELIEKDERFFREAYEYDGYAPVRHLIMPVTYRCNLSCRYCYAHSNYKHTLPADRSIDRMVEIVKGLNCPTVNLAGGEPTVREDLPELLAALKERAVVKKLCVVTNGQRTVDEKYLRLLRDQGMDFLFLPLFIPGYDPEGAVVGNVMKSLDNAYRLRIPVWIQAAVERIDQVPPVLAVIEKYRKVIFNITIRSVRPYGITDPRAMVHVSEIIRSLGKENDYRFGNHPFNRHVMLHGRAAKISYWVNDRNRLDPFDATYVIHDDSVVPFHKGMILDDVHFQASRWHC